VWRERRIPSYKFRRADKIQPLRSQRRHVQRLADVARIIRAAGMFVKETSPRGEVQNRRASEQRQRALPEFRSEF
jgi:hypothetical protein